MIIFIAVLSSQIKKCSRRNRHREKKVERNKKERVLDAEQITLFDQKVQVSRSLRLCIRLLIDDHHV